MGKEKWHGDLLAKAYVLAAASRDPSTQNCAMLVQDWQPYVMNLWDVNQFTRGISESQENWQRPLKYSYVEHAERNVIYEAARQGIKTDSLTMVCCWAACADCARAIVKSGIKTLVTHRYGDSYTWGETIAIADKILEAGGVELVVFNDPLPCRENLSVRRNGELFYPGRKKEEAVCL